jgi:hypothetical protein
MGGESMAGGGGWMDTPLLPRCAVLSTTSSSGIRLRPCARHRSLPLRASDAPQCTVHDPLPLRDHAHRGEGAGWAPCSSLSQVKRFQVQAHRSHPHHVM